MSGRLTLREVVGSNIKTVRLARGWSQTDLGKRVGLSVSAISMLERGVRAASFDVLERLATATKHSEAWYLWRAW